MALFLPGVRLTIADVAKRLAVNRHAARDALNGLKRNGAIYVCGKARYGANIYAAPDHRSDDAKLLDTLRDGRERLASEIAPLVGKTPCEVSKAMVRLIASRKVAARRMPGTWAYLHGYRLA
jgi:DNA-binding IclR family transcriptional regulator